LFFFLLLQTDAVKIGFMGYEERPFEAAVRPAEGMTRAFPA